MSLRRPLYVLVVLVALATLNLSAAELVPFRGNWTGSTVSAEFLSPTLVKVVSAGTGTAAHLGRFYMETPHLSYMDTLQVVGTQHFIAANGDRIDAYTEGYLAPNADGSLEGTLSGTITGGTGRFEGASGTYQFHLVARPGAFGFDTVADFDGVISSPGSN